MTLLWLLSSALWVLSTVYPSQGGSLQSWIVGGKEAIPNSWPFIASLQIQGQHFCGGSLIAPNFLITAAHCLMDLNPSFVTIVLGAHSLSANEATRQTFRISRIFENGFNPRTLENDILVVKLNRAADLNATVQTVKLPKQNQTVPTGTQCVTAGWGQLATQGPSSDQLQELNVTTTGNRLCRSTNICTRVSMRQAGICFGDSGGPLVCNDILHGLSSFIIRSCGSGVAPDFFARVALFRSFIDSALAN
ncbi:neutrophil elastase [Microcaecilia unicolor]|uniref:Neutrophil elastase-like n=1 Tax=Microcaecilia unicolor TaxID=1415580 RepID=A0A6P7Z761_9AMPH|nr:neutrophil elastase-like [Microcaecilia unicolor]